MKNFRRGAVIALALAGLLVIAGALMGASAGGRGVISHKYQTLVAGTTGYTTTFNTSAVDMGLFGMVEIQGLASIIPATGTVTATAQWSDQPVPCTQVTSWTPVASVYNEPADAMSFPLMTFTANAATPATLNVIVGVPVMARCFRIVYTPDPVVTTRYTPTVYIRMVNHD